MIHRHLSLEFLLHYCVVLYFLFTHFATYISRFYCDSFASWSCCQSRLLYMWCTLIYNLFFGFLEILQRNVALFILLKLTTERSLSFHWLYRTDFIDMILNWWWQISISLLIFSLNFTFVFLVLSVGLNLWVLIQSRFVKKGWFIMSFMTGLYLLMALTTTSNFF